MEIRDFLHWLAGGFRARWQTILLIAAVNSGVAGLSVIDDPRPFWHPFVSSHCIGFSVAYCVNLISPWQKDRPLLKLILAVSLGAITGTLLIILVKQYGWAYVMAEPKKFIYTACLGLVNGLFVSLFFFNQRREAMNQAALLNAQAEQNLLKQQAAEAQLQLMQAQVEPQLKKSNRVFTVVDMGRGLPDDIGDGVGLSNIRDRLRALLGDAARIDLEQNVPHGVQARISVPYVYA